MNTRKIVAVGVVAVLLAIMFTPSLGAADGVPRIDIEKFALSLGDDAKTFVEAGNGKRCDIVWGKFAIIVAHAPDWDASVGRALSCGVRLRKSPALLLIVADDAEWSSVREAAVVARRYQIALNIVSGEKPDRGGMPAVPERVNVNIAGAEELEALPGIGPVIARRILDERAKLLFASAEDLLRVKGIGEKALADLKDQISVK